MLDQPIENALHCSSVCFMSCRFDPFLLKRASLSQGDLHQWPYHVPVSMHLCVYGNANAHPGRFFVCFEGYLCATCIFPI